MVKLTKQTTKHYFISAGLLAISAVSFGIFLSSSPQQKVSQNIENKVLSAQTSPTQTPPPTGKSINGWSANSRFVAASSTGIPTSVSQPKVHQQEPTATPPPDNVPTAVPTAETVQLHVSINGGNEFTLTIEQGKNQCDVLAKALQDGKISQLLMRFDSNLGSYAVYQINGLGKENSVWWVYKVNGQSPSQGCSYIQVSNGDRVSWEYIGH